MDTIQSIMKGKLLQRTHPIVPGSASRQPNNQNQHQQQVPPDQVVPEEILIFMVGGITYEEGTKIAEFNESMKSRGIQVILGGSTVHNSTSFLDELKSTTL
jgi:vacuolar protein sorting-associated protein 45